MKDHTDPDLCALMGSRLCHDLISPLGAIANGMELLEMTSATPSPEMDLIRQSVDNVNARIRFFRIAFGLAGHEQQTGRREIASILKDYFPAGRLTVTWHPQNDLPRLTAKALFLAILCVEGTLPAGGTIDVETDGDGWCVRAEGPKLRILPEAWDHLAGNGPMPDEAPQVHFALLAHWARLQGRAIVAELGESRVEIRL